MDGIKIIRDEKQFPVCSGYNCNKLLNIDNENVFNDSYVPMGLVIFPREIQISINDNEDYIQVIENENNEIQNKLIAKIDAYNKGLILLDDYVPTDGPMLVAGFFENVR